MVDGTLLEASASHRSFRPEDHHDGIDGDDFRGHKRSIDTHAPTTDPDARLIRKGKGKEAKLSYLTDSLIENCHGLVIGVDVRHASDTDVRGGAHDLLLAAGVQRGATLAANKGYDRRDFVAVLRTRGIAPHISRNPDNGRRRAIPRDVARTRGYRISQRVSKRTALGPDHDHRRAAQAADGRPRRGARLGDLDVCRPKSDPPGSHRWVVGALAEMSRVGRRESAGAKIRSHARGKENHALDRSYQERYGAALLNSLLKRRSAIYLQSTETEVIKRGIQSK